MGRPCSLQTPDRAYVLLVVAPGFATFEFDKINIAETTDRFCQERFQGWKSLFFTEYRGDGEGAGALRAPACS